MRKKKWCYNCNKFPEHKKAWEELYGAWTGPNHYNDLKEFISKMTSHNCNSWKPLIKARWGKSKEKIEL